MKAGTLYVGTSGWSYPHWGNGRFYPKGLKPGEWLGYLARRFPTVEVNSTFYRLPTEGMVERWRGVTGARFRFAVKLWRMITHRKRLRECGELLAQFFAMMRGLDRKRGPVLIQLPPSMHKDVALLDDFLSAVWTSAQPAAWRIAVEFRHPSWSDDQTVELLDGYRAALCLADMPRCPFTRPGNAGFVYIRRHGPGGRYRGRYGAAHIRTDADSVQTWRAAGRDVYVFYNNDIEGHAVDNARQLIEACAI